MWIKTRRKSTRKVAVILAKLSKCIVELIYQSKIPPYLHFRDSHWKDINNFSRPCRLEIFSPSAYLDFIYAIINLRRIFKTSLTQCAIVIKRLKLWSMFSLTAPYFNLLKKFLITIQWNNINKIPLDYKIFSLR